MLFAPPQSNAFANAINGTVNDARVAPVSSTLSPDALNKIAQSRGYRDYDHMIYVAKNGLPKPKQDNGTFPSQGNQGGGIVNFLQQLFADPKAALSDAFAWHPANTIGMAASALQQANGQ